MRCRGVRTATGPRRLQLRSIGTVASALLVAGGLLAFSPLEAGNGSAAEQGDGFFSNLFQTYTPRRVCMNYEAAVVWLHVYSDILIAVSYFSIPIALIAFVRRRDDLAFNWMFRMFAMFIFACGVTHLFGVVDIWMPVYKVDGMVKLATGLISAATAVLLWRLIPSAVALPSPAHLRTANEQLGRMRDELELRVADRTRELALASERERASRAEAERANHAKDEFLANLSHELRTPLNSILGWTQLLTQDSLPEDKRHAGVEVIERNARAQIQLIEDLLDTSRIVSGRLKLEVRETDLTRLIESVVETVQPAVQARQIRLATVLDPQAGPVRGDPDRLQQVLWNLLSNALKFTPKGGRISIFLERVNSHVEISVSDNGSGIVPDVLPYVFDRFRQEDSGTARRKGGLGLGLSIVRTIVELHGGSVRAESDGEGRGATFVVSLPRAPVQPAVDSSARVHPTAPLPVPLQHGANPDSSRSDLEGVRVLVVDDEGDARDLIRLLLERAGALVMTVESTAEALREVAGFRPEVIVSDIGMPDEDGFSFLRRLRRLTPEQGGDTPALALTAFARAEDRRTALLSGFQLHLAKPVEPAELVVAVASLASRGARLRQSTDPPIEHGDHPSA